MVTALFDCGVHLFLIRRSLSVQTDAMADGKTVLRSKILGDFTFMWEITVS